MAHNLLYLSENDFQQTIESGVTLVDFYANWCGPCRVLGPIVEQLSSKVEGKAKVAKLDIDQAQQIANDLQITSIPTIILFKDGKEVKRVVGIKDLEYLLQLVTSHL